MGFTFEQIYRQLSEKHRPQLEAIRKSRTRKLWIAGFLCTAAAVLILMVFIEEYFEDYFVIALMLGAFFFYKRFLKYPYALSLYFRENIAKSFVALVDPSLSYSPEFSQHGSILNQYHSAHFDGETPPANTTKSPGLSNFITGKIEGRHFQLCCMSLLRFQGLFVNMKVSKNLNGFIKVQQKMLCDIDLDNTTFMQMAEQQKLDSVDPDKIWESLFDAGTNFIPRAEVQRINSVIFEKDFLVGSNSQITAMQYLTVDVMELLLNLKNELAWLNINRNPNSIRLDFFWRGDEVLMRIDLNEKLFIPTMRDPMCKDSLACCLSSLRFATKFNQVITK